MEVRFSWAEYWTATIRSRGRINSQWNRRSWTCSINGTYERLSELPGRTRQQTHKYWIPDRGDKRQDTIGERRFQFAGHPPDGTRAPSWQCSRLDTSRLQKKKRPAKEDLAVNISWRSACKRSQLERGEGASGRPCISAKPATHSPENGPDELSAK